MTNREREYASLGIEYAEGIELARVIRLPSGREVRQVSPGCWEAQPPNDNYWKQFDDCLAVCRFALGKPVDSRAWDDYDEHDYNADYPDDDLD